MRPIAESTAHNARLDGPGCQGGRALPPLSGLLEQLLLRSECGRRRVGGPVLRLLLLPLVRGQRRSGRIQFVQNHAAARHGEAECKAEEEQLAHILRIAPNAKQLELRARCRRMGSPQRRRRARRVLYAPRCPLRCWPRRGPLAPNIRVFCYGRQPMPAGTRPGTSSLCGRDVEACPRSHGRLRGRWSLRERRTHTLPPPPSL